jgi:CheY-like chemotaxis protein
MSWTPSARFVEVEAAGTPFADALEATPDGGSRRDEPLQASASDGRPPGADQVCAHCGFARGVHAFHCPVFAAALDSIGASRRLSGVPERLPADEFTRALPAEKDPPLDDDLARERAHPACPNLIEPQPRVLVADDHPVHRQWSRVIFEALACSVAVVEDGAAALALCAVEAFDLVLIDRHMPVLGGDEAVRRLRAGRGPSSQAYVAICSSDPPGDPAAGYDAIAPKPLDVDTACVLLTEALTAAASRAKQT